VGANRRQRTFPTGADTRSTPPREKQLRSRGCQKNTVIAASVFVMRRQLGASVLLLVVSVGCGEADNDAHGDKSSASGGASSGAGSAGGPATSNAGAGASTVLTTRSGRTAAIRTALATTATRFWKDPR
jgi:hypothetical protein